MKDWFTASFELGGRRGVNYKIIIIFKRINYSYLLTMYIRKNGNNINSISVRELDLIELKSNLIKDFSKIKLPGYIVDKTLVLIDYTFISMEAIL